LEIPFGTKQKKYINELRNVTKVSNICSKKRKWDRRKDRSSKWLVQVLHLLAGWFGGEELFLVC
jgi:hypothetical protein